MPDFQLEELLPPSFSPRERELSFFVHRQHGEQLRKYNGEPPYVTHLISVAFRVQEVTHDPVLVAAALCHDLLEDTDCTEEFLGIELLKLGYSHEECTRILAHVLALTDRYTPEQYPKLNRKKRKTLEAKRLVTISPEAATVKLADLLDNMESIARFDPGFARVFFAEIGLFLPALNKGNPHLFERAMQLYEKESRSLSSN